MKGFYLMNLLVSACLLGYACRYDSKSKPNENVLALKEKFTLIPFCPEIYGGLATPRDPAERQGDRVVTKKHLDVTTAYQKGASEALKLAQATNCHYAILKEKSPSCGKGKIYDGSFQKKLISGNGITTELLLKNKIAVFGESELEQFLKAFSNNPKTNP